MRKPSRPNEAAFQEALRRLRKSLKNPGDMSWQDNLPEAPPIPEDPDETIAIIIPTKKASPRKRPAR